MEKRGSNNSQIPVDRQRPVNLQVPSNLQRAVDLELSINLDLVPARESVTNPHQLREE